LVGGEDDGRDEKTDGKDREAANHLLEVVIAGLGRFVGGFIGGRAHGC
jgi:hypothetical protein